MKNDALGDNNARTNVMVKERMEESVQGATREKKYKKTVNRTDATMMMNGISWEPYTIIQKSKDVAGVFDNDATVSYLYTPLSVAREELQKRWQNEDLKMEVEKFLGVVPDVFQEGFNAALFRFIATPDLECQLAQDMASLAGFNFVFMEFLNDKFCTRNADKMHLGKLSFFKDKAKNNPESGSRVKVIDLVQSEGVSFRQLKTLQGESFIDFHHRIFQTQGDMIPTFDVSRFKTNGETASEVYMKVFSLFICHGVLFENYFVHTNEDENRFTHEVIIPTFEAIYQKFGVRPLIVPIISNEDEDASWQFYPSEIVPHLNLQA